MEIKEQIKDTICNICEYWYSDYPAYEMPMRCHCSGDCSQEWIIEDIIKIFEQAGYLPIQAGEDGLAKNPYIELIGGFNEIKPTMFDKLSPVDQIRMMGQKEGYEQGRKAQKALDDKEKEELVKKAIDLADRIFEFAWHGDYSNGIEAYGIDEGNIRAGECLKGFEKEIKDLKQTLEELR